MEYATGFIPLLMPILVFMVLPAVFIALGIRLVRAVERRSRDEGELARLAARVAALEARVEAPRSQD